MRRLVAILAAGAVGMAAPGARGAVSPSPGPVDARVRIVHYEPDQVVELKATLGYQTTIEFGPGERIENVAIGDGLGWQVTPNHKANLLFLKPLDAQSVTDMTVVTNMRRYVFDLSARHALKRSDKGLIFRLKFEYPEVFVAVPEIKPPAPPAPPRDANHAYHLEGSPKLAPLRVFDDGRDTYFVFGETTEYPAIFAVDPDRKEAVVNSATRDGYVVVDRLAGAFVLRRGGEITRVVNDGFIEPGAAMPLRPKRAKRHRGLFG